MKEKESNQLIIIWVSAIIITGISILLFIKPNPNIESVNHMIEKIEQFEKGYLS